MTACAGIFIRNLFAVVMVFGIYSLVCAAFFLVLDAPDVALTEAAIGAGIAPLLMLGTLAFTKRQQKPTSAHGIWLPLLVVSVTGAALVYGTLDMPHFGALDTPTREHVAPRYIEESGTEIDVPNIVTSVLASYRGFDTLGEVFVIFTAGIGVISLLGVAGRNGTPSLNDMRQHLVLSVISKAMIPLLLLYGLYIQFHGDFGPGGGFQAGVIFAAGFILYSMVYRLENALQVVKPGVLLAVMAIGALLYGGTGVAGMLLGGNFLDYNVLDHHDPVHGQHLGIILVEAGVGLTVAAVMMTLFFSFSWQITTQELEEGE